VIRFPSSPYLGEGLRHSSLVAPTTIPHPNHQRPSRPETPSRQHIARPVDAEIHPAHPDQHREQAEERDHRRAPCPASPAVARHALGQHQRQRQIDRGRDHRMAAGEAGIGYLDQMRDELGPGRATALARRQKSVRFGPSNARFPPEVRLLCHRRDRDQQA